MRSGVVRCFFYLSTQIHFINVFAFLFMGYRKYLFIVWVEGNHPDVEGVLIGSLGFYLSLSLTCTLNSDRSVLLPCAQCFSSLR